MRVVFMGTPDFAVDSLRALAADPQYEIVAVVSQPDRPRGRGGRLLPTPVKAAAQELGLPVFQPQRVKTKEFEAQLREWAPDFVVVAAFGQLLSREILSAPRYACVNVHASLLPKYRGAAPLHYALLNGETESGVTLMHMEQGMDTGAMYAKTVVPITPEMTQGELHDACKIAGAKLLTESLPKIAAGKLAAQPQNDAEATKATLLTPAMEVIDWTRPAAEIHNKIRAFNPAPGAYTTLPDGKRLKIFASRVREFPTGISEELKKPGTVCCAARKMFCVACGTGALELVEVQPESKKRMSAINFKNNGRVELGYRFGG